MRKEFRIWSSSAHQINQAICRSPSLVTPASSTEKPHSCLSDVLPCLLSLHSAGLLSPFDQPSASFSSFHSVCPATSHHLPHGSEMSAPAPLSLSPPRSRFPGSPLCPGKTPSRGRLRAKVPAGVPARPAGLGAS